MSLISEIFGTASNIGLGAIRKVTDIWRAAKADSLIDYTQVARVEPIVLIDTECLYSESLPDLQQSLLSIFAGYYLQAVAISTSVGKIEVMRHLDKLNPSRNASNSAADSMGWLLAQESYKHCLPTFEKKLVLESLGLEASDNGVIGSPTSSDWKVDEARRNYERELGLKNRSANQAAIDARDRREQAEATAALNNAKNEEQIRQWTADRIDKLAKAGFDRDQATKQTNLAADKFKEDKKQYGEKKAMDNLRYELEKDSLQLRRDEREDRLTASEISFGRDTHKDLKELSNLSVGKMFSVEITDGLHKATIQVAIRLMASSLPSDSLVHIFSIGSKDTSAKERYHAWKSGRIEFIKDLCLCQDLIDEHRKNLMADKDGIYTNLLKRARSNQLSTIVSANPSVATSSNMVIVSQNTADKLELHLNGKLKDFHVREKMMKETYMMIFCILDERYGRITIYHRGINHPTELGIKDIKSANSNNGISVTDVLKSYQLGNQPSL